MVLQFSLFALLSDYGHGANKHSNMVEHISWVLSDLSVGVHKTVNRIGRTCTSLLSRTHRFSCILQDVQVTPRFHVLFQLLNVKKTINCKVRYIHCKVWQLNIFLAHCHSLNMLQIFSYWASCKQPHPQSNLHRYPLTVAKNVCPKMAQATSQNDLQFIFTADGWMMYPFNLPLSAPACCWVPFRLTKHCLSTSLSQLQSNSQAELSKPTREDFKISKRKRTRRLSEYIPRYQPSLQCNVCILQQSRQRERYM